VTVAPECIPKGLIRQLTDHGVCIAIGHANATYEEASIALAEGAQGFTHLFNAMTPLKSREPGCVGAALDDETSWFTTFQRRHGVKEMGKPLGAFGEGY
jgi:N-acetylglucosamine-6-phosphate deacetylase